MIKRLTNTQEFLLKEPIIEQTEIRKHLYILEILSPMTIDGPSGRFIVDKFDVILAQELDFFMKSQQGEGIIARLASIYFDLPAPIHQYAVGDNPLIHDLMNEEISSQAFVLFKGLEAQVCHAYMTAIENLQALEVSDNYVKFQVQKVAGLLFTELLRDHRVKISKSASQFPTTQVKYASKETQSGVIMKYVTEHIQQISLKETAEHFSYQTNYFSRLIHDLFGVTFNELKKQIRLELAKEQLRLTTKSLEEISQELGYKAVSNFHRNFKAETGQTPREYRQSLLNPFLD